MSRDERRVAQRAAGSVALLLAASTLWIAGRHWLAPDGSPLSPASAALRIDPNRATQAELELLPQIGPALASAIIERREHAAHQPAFRSIADLDAVRGIGPATLEAVAPHLTFPNDGR